MQKKENSAFSKVVSVWKCREQKQHRRPVRLSGVTSGQFLSFKGGLSTTKLNKSLSLKEDLKQKSITAPINRNERRRKNIKKQQPFFSQSLAQFVGKNWHLKVTKAWLWLLSFWRSRKTWTQLACVAAVSIMSWASYAISVLPWYRANKHSCMHPKELKFKAKQISVT